MILCLTNVGSKAKQIEIFVGLILLKEKIIFLKQSLIIVFC
jgi:hypothetical protein